MNKLLIVLAILNISGLGAGSYFIYKALSEPLVPKAKVITDTEEYLVYNDIFKDKPILYTLDTFTVNLANIEEDKKVLVEVNVELNDEKSFQEVMKQSAAVRDAVFTVIAKREHADIATVQGKLFLKDDIASAINKHLESSLIKGVYFTKFFIE